MKISKIYNIMIISVISLSINMIVEAGPNDYEIKLSDTAGVSAFELQDSNGLVLARMGSDGKSGIGTSTPSAVLDVVGTSTISTALNVTGTLTVTGGNLGIGTSTPKNTLHAVLGSGTLPSGFDGTELVIVQNNDDVNDWAGITIISGNGGGSFIDFGDADSIFSGNIGYFHTDNEMFFYTNRAVNVTPQMAITSNGDVGIGTSTPATNQKLHVSGNIQVGESSSVKGITLFDTVDGSAHCVKITSDALAVTAGACP